MSVKSIFSKIALLKLAIILPSFILLTVSCSNDDNDNGGNGKEEINLNKNEVTTDKAVTRLEFPRLKGGNSIVLIYRTKGDKQYDKDEINYCVEWDCSKKSQRWSCYQMHQGYEITAV